MYSGPRIIAATPSHTHVVFLLCSKSATTARGFKHRQSPMDFGSMSLAARTQCHALVRMRCWQLILSVTGGGGQGFESPRCRMFGCNAVLFGREKEERAVGQSPATTAWFLGLCHGACSVAAKHKPPMLATGLDSRRAHMPCSSTRKGAFAK